jgi:lipase chaperone LimK
MQTHLRWPVVGCVLLGLCVSLWWWTTAPHASPEQTHERVRWSPASQFTHIALGDSPTPVVSDGAAPALGSGVPELEQIEHVLFEHGSLRGTTLDGDWGLDAHGQLQPSRALRRRFDQLLTTQGEVSREELGVWLRAKASKDVGVSAAQAIMQIWHKYLVLEGQEYRYGVRLDEPESLRWALQERQIKRREILGVAWAAAFYAEEEALLTQSLASDHTPQTTTSNAPAAPAAHAALPHLNAAQAHALRSAQFGTAAADRLAALDAQEAVWHTRLTQARVQWDSISNTPQWSPVQQQAYFSQWLDGHFEERERVRVRALLGL